MNKNKISQPLLRSLLPPIDDITRLQQKVGYNRKLSLLDLSQAVPSGPPPLALQKAIRLASLKPENHRYGSILGKSELRKTIAKRWSKLYKSNISMNEVGVTSGCNQAF